MKHGHPTGIKRQRPMSARERARLEALGAWIAQQQQHHEERDDTMRTYYIEILDRNNIWSREVVGSENGFHSEAEAQRMIDALKQLDDPAWAASVYRLVEED